MAGRIRQSDVDEVKARTNIADIVGEQVVEGLRPRCRIHDVHVHAPLREHPRQPRLRTAAIAIGVDVRR